MLVVNLTINELAYVVNELRDPVLDDIPPQITRFGFAGTTTKHDIAVKLARVLLDLDI